MPKYDIYSDNPLEMIWAIREKIREETKDMSNEEYHAYIQKKGERVDKEVELRRQQVATARSAGIRVQMSWE